MYRFVFKAPICNIFILKYQLQNHFSPPDTWNEVNGFSAIAAVFLDHLLLHYETLNTGLRYTLREMYNTYKYKHNYS